jgi:hypothetical protein
MADLGYYKMHALIVDDFENFRGTLYKMPTLQPVVKRHCVFAKRAVTT